MNWEETLKASSDEEDTFEMYFAQLKEQYEKTIAHPNYSEESIYSFTKNTLGRRVVAENVGDSYTDYSPHFFTFYEELIDGANLTSDYFKEFMGKHTYVKVRPDIGFSNRGMKISEEAYYNELIAAASTFTIGFLLAYENAAEKRSMGWLEDFAKTLGVDTNVVYSHRGQPARVEFSHDGLNFSMRPNSLRIYLPRISKNARIRVCVVDSNQLPIGDYYTQLLGLVVNKPEELDVVGFAIDLAKIVLGVEMRSFFENINRFNISIYTPFRASNEENEEFGDFMKLLKEEGTYNGRPDLNDTRGYALQQILDSLEKHFGSYMGWF